MLFGNAIDFAPMMLQNLTIMPVIYCHTQFSILGSMCICNFTRVQQMKCNDNGCMKKKSQLGNEARYASES